MAMRMLGAGGLPLLVDDRRAADASNPLGYFEYEPVKTLDRDGGRGWLPSARGRGVKIVSWLLTHLPEAYDYQVVFMERALEEVIASQDAMLDARGEPRGADQARTRAVYVEHLAQVERFLARRRCFEVLRLDHGRVVTDPGGESRRLQAFLGRHLDVAAMAAAVDRSLHRQTRKRGLPHC
jgi:hypothetical protein